ncbi:flagellar basal-body MS-ring/collar protein FliF [Paracoccus methylarcula]|uniref:Flagellar M-ring protein n=1 Tax=Paracoccus methylarcula TaxID=72022 RepID=A0A3R7P2F0_9RHOB|nr:flagellar basal-body MS-ring/collar protein FliF [Paracoccus methylarcula]RNF32914.1 flagellar M-ring protein FliF [Paracoccus methylarcula]
MQKLQDYWTERSSKQKAILVAAFLTAFAAITAIGWLANRTDMALLYGGLDPAQAGEVIAGIEGTGIKYQVHGNSIWVDAAQRDRLRVELAAQGLPTVGGAGYEILDGMSGFGTTAQMFDAAYWRAKEGELARTVLALPNVKSARVHLGIEQGRGYRRDTDGSASVTLTTNGPAVTREQAAALKYLVSSAVPEMQPENVTVIDSRHGIVNTGEDQEGQERAAQMKRNVERILESHVGKGNAIVELNLDVVTETEQLLEQRIDPDQRALISQVTEETSDQSNSTGKGAVTAASNLPDTEEAQGDSSQSQRSENRQQANYEVSTVTREVSKRPGAIRRLSVAVLVNGVVQNNAQGDPQVVPRPDSELLVLQELVASTVGFDEQRGDVITVKSLPFADLAQNGTLAKPGLLDRLHLNDLVRIALFGFFALAILLVLLRAARRSAPAASVPADRPLLDDSGPSNEPLPAMFEQDDDDEPFDPQSFSNPIPLQLDPLSPGEGEQLALPPADPVARLRSMMRDRQDESIKILSGWIENRKGT